MEPMQDNQKADHRWKMYRLTLWLIVAFAVAAICLIMLVDIYRAVPDTIYLKAGEESQFSLGVPLSGEVTIQNREPDVQTFGEAAVQTLDDAMQGIETGTVENGQTDSVSSAAGTLAVAGMENEAIPVDLSGTVTMLAGDVNSYSMNLRLFGIIPFKTVRIEVLSDSLVYPVGMPIGIYVKTTGVLIVGTGDFTSFDHVTVMPSEHLLQTGDYILSVDGVLVEGKADFVRRVAASEGNVMVMTIERDGEQFDVGVRPVRNEAGEYKLGIWVKDSAQGIGTLTYIDSDGHFGALGHGVSDSDIGVLLNLSDGALYRTDIIGITKGQRGIPGELTGIIRYTESNRIGIVTENTPVGIHGIAGETLMASLEMEPLPIGLKQEVSRGEAQIYCNVDGRLRYYDVVITDIDYDSGNINKGITLQVTDPELLSITGGIVQGMSGSPIVQDGKLVGAITHVLVNDPQRGYGIFIESMLE